MSAGHSRLDADEQYQQQEELELPDELVPRTKRTEHIISLDTHIQKNVLYVSYRKHLRIHDLMKGDNLDHIIIMEG